MVGVGGSIGCHSCPVHWTLKRLLLTNLVISHLYFTLENSAQLSLCSAWLSVGIDMVLVYNWHGGGVGLGGR